MLYFKRGHNALKISATGNALFRQYASCRHKEPKELSWQWSVKKTPELMRCKNLCVSKICPKPSFFPRFKKVFVPANKKACVNKKPPMSWKEYLSFLLPNPVSKPPLITCRKLQAERRRVCGNPMNCSENCLRVNCCPPPKEWYGQAEIFAVPSSLPPTVVSHDQPQPCAPPPSAEPTCVLALKGICPLPRKSLNMDDYAYKKAFSGINLCDEIREVTRSFQCKSVCVPQLPGNEKNVRLSCGFYSEFKEVECPKAITMKNAAFELPSLVYSDEGKGTDHKKEINVEVKKGICGRTTLLKPYKYGDKLPISNNSCKFHSITYKIKLPTQIQRKMFHSTPHDLTKQSTGDEGRTQQNDGFKANMKLEDMGVSSYLQKDSYCQPSKSGVGLNYMLLKPLSGMQRDGYVAPVSYYSNEDNYNYNSQEIDPELIKLAEETKKNMTYGVPTNNNGNKNTINTLAKQLSKAAEQKVIKKFKEKGEERPITPTTNPYQKSKLSLLKKRKNPTVVTHATFMTEANLNLKYAKKKNNKSKKEKKNIICEGCLGIKAAEMEEKNPTPKSFIDCKVRPAGRCRGPQRKVHPDEGEPNNPYWKNKQRPYSLCNQPRPAIKKKERPYKMPCEDKSNTKRDFHSSSSQIKYETNNLNMSRKSYFHSTASLLDTGTNIPTLYDILKINGLRKCTKQPQNHSNDWDSHTSDSYGERIYEEYDSLPDLSKYQPKDNDATIKKMSFPVNLWENPDNKNKTDPHPWSNNEGNKNSVEMNKIGSNNHNITFKKRTSMQNITKESNITPSKYNVLFNPTTIKKQAENNDKSISNFLNKVNSQETKFSEINIANSKTNGVFDFKPGKELNTANPKELPTCPVTAQNRWGEQYPSNSQSSQTIELVPQEMKSWDKQKSQSLLKDSFMDDSSTHNMFRSKEEPNKVLSKQENESQSMFYKEKMSVLSDSGDLANVTTLNGSKS